MFEGRSASAGPGSVFEELLRSALVDLTARRVWIVDFEPHGRRSQAPAVDGDGDGPQISGFVEPREQGAVSPAVDVEGPRISGFRELLERGAAALADAQAAAREQARQAAVQARALAAFARCRPAKVLDRPAAEVGAAAAASRAARPEVLTEVSEWAVDEVMAALRLPARTASALLEHALTLVERLPATLAALEAGVLDWPRARMLADLLGPLNDELRAGVEAHVLAGAAERTLPQLAGVTRRAVLRADAAAAAARLATAVRNRAVRLMPDEDGMATLTAGMSAPVAAACYAALEGYAQACVTPGDERIKGQRMVDCLAELILQPGLHGPVQVQLQVVAGVDTLRGGEEPGEIGGMPVPAILVRELAHTLGLLLRPDTPAPEQHAAPEAAAAPDRSAHAEDQCQDPGQHQDQDQDQGTAASNPRADGQPAQHINAAEAVEPTEPVEHVGPLDHMEPVEHGEPVEPVQPAERLNTAERVEDALRAGSAERVVPQGAVAPGGRVLSGSERAAMDLAALLGIPTTAGTTLAALPEIAVIDEISGELLALTSATEIRRIATCTRRACRTGRRPCTHLPAGPGLGPPPAGSGYAPTERLTGFVRARDRRCRFPGCRARAIRCDLDHNTPWPHGTTSADNLCCLCRHHHRLSHQAPGWRMRRLPDGGLRWTTPSGQTLTTYPPRHGTDDHPPPTPTSASAPAWGDPSPADDPTADPATSPPRTLRERVLGRPRKPGEPDDPAPF